LNKYNLTKIGNSVITKKQYGNVFVNISLNFANQAETNPFRKKSLLIYQQALKVSYSITKTKSLLFFD
jgi:hypothetical protein